MRQVLILAIASIEDAATVVVRIVGQKTCGAGKRERFQDAELKPVYPCGLFRL